MLKQSFEKIKKCRRKTFKIDDLLNKHNTHEINVVTAQLVAATAATCDIGNNLINQYKLREDFFKGKVT